MSARDIKQMQREEFALSSLNHPNIIRIHDAIALGGIHCTIMDYYPEGSLADKLGHGPMNLLEVGSIVEQIAGAVDFAHSKGIIHQDIKPANILIHQGRAVLSDFGIARVIGEHIATRATGQDSYVGTPSYMSPEQVTGYPTIGTATDQYSLAVVAYEMLTGRLPHSGDTPLAILYSKVENPAPRLSRLNPNISPSVEQVVLKGLAKSPNKRFKSATGFAMALNEAIRFPNKSRPQLVKHKTFPEILPKLSAREGLFLVFLCAFLGSFFGTLLAVLMFGS